MILGKICFFFLSIFLRISLAKVLPSILHTFVSLKGATAMLNDKKNCIISGSECRKGCCVRSCAFVTPNYNDTILSLRGDLSLAIGNVNNPTANVRQIKVKIKHVVPNNN